MTIHIIFDYDYTLFDTAYLISKIPRKLEKGENFTQELANEIDWTNVDKDKLHFPQTNQTLQQLQSRNIELYLFTEGNIKGQQLKFEYTGISQLIKPSHTFIYQEKKLAHLNDIIQTIPKSDTVFYIEDKPSYLKEAKRQFPQIQTVHIKQGPWQDFPLDNFYPDITINSLSEILKYL